MDEYIATFPKDVQAALKAVRRAIRNAVPGAEEFISYQMPAYRFHGRLLYFAAYKKHFSLFGASREVYAAFKKELLRYEGGTRGTIRFPLDEPVPVKLIGRIAKYRAKENLGKEKAK